MAPGGHRNPTLRSARGWWIDLWVSDMMATGGHQMWFLRLARELVVVLLFGRSRHAVMTCQKGVSEWWVSELWGSGEQVVSVWWVGEHLRGWVLLTKKQVKKLQKNNTRDSNVVPHRSTNLARQCLTSLSRREAVLSLWYGRSWYYDEKFNL